MINPKNKIEIFADATQLGKAAAEFIIKLAQDSVTARGRFTIALSGGSTPELLFTLLADSDYKERLPWDKTFVFWGDERYVPATDIRNNAFVAQNFLLSKVSIPASHIFPVPVYIQPATGAAKAYELLLKTFFGNQLPQFDLIMLGIGENAHTASLFPHTPVIHEQYEWISAVYVDEVKMDRVTMTAPLINNAHNILFMATGQGKAEVIKTVLTAPYQPDQYPAQLISPVHGNLYWFLDQNAASLVS